MNKQNNLPVSKKKRKHRKKKEENFKKDYFGEIQEEAFKEYMESLDEKRKTYLFITYIDPALKALVKGIMRMPKFQKLIGLDPVTLEEDAYYHALLQLQLKKFKPETVGKNGQPAKAYSYFGTCIKNYILGEKKKADARIAEYGGFLDINELTDQIADKRGGAQSFEVLRQELLIGLESVLKNQKLNTHDLTVGSVLKLMVVNWHKLEFQTKNEFMRQLGYYTDLPQSVIARSLKKIRNLTYLSIKKSNE
jgi:hypothetical protein